MKSQLKNSKLSLRKILKLKSTRKKFIKLTLQLFLHYVDQVLDLVCAITSLVYQINIGQEQTIDIYLMKFFLFFVLFYERYQTYFFNIKLMEAIEEKQDQLNFESSKKTSKQKQNISLKMIMTYSEPILYVEMFQLQIEVDKYLREKKLQDVIVENTYFLLHFLYQVMFGALMNGEISYLHVVSIVSSLLTSSIILYQNTMQKFQQEYQQFRDRNWSDFKNLSTDLKLALSYPCKCHILKFVSENNQVFMKELRYEKKVKIQNKLNVKRKFFMTVYSMILINCMYIGLLIGQGIQYLSNQYLKSEYQILACLLCYSPQIFRYLQVYIQEKNEKIGFKHVMKCIQKIPIIIIVAPLQLFLPGFNEHLPFIKETTQKWTTNFLNDVYIITVRFLYCLYVFYLCYPIFMQRDSSLLIPQISESYVRIEYVLNRNNVLYLSFMTFFVSFIILSFICILYILEYVISIIQNKKRIIEFQQEDEVSQQNVEINKINKESNQNIMTEDGGGSPIRLLNQQYIYQISDQINEQNPNQIKSDSNFQQILQQEGNQREEDGIFFGKNIKEEGSVNLEAYYFPSENGTREKTKKYDIQK